MYIETESYQVFGPFISEGAAKLHAKVIEKVASDQYYDHNIMPIDDSGVREWYLLVTYIHQQVLDLSI